MTRLANQVQDSTTLGSDIWAVVDASSGKRSSDSATSDEVDTSAGIDYSATLKRFSKSAAGVMFRTLICNDATSQFIGAQRLTGWAEGCPTTRVAEDRVREMTRQMYRKLSKLEPSELEYGTRFSAIADAIGDAPNEAPGDYCDALNRMLLVNSKFVSNEAKSALIRYTTFLDDGLPLSKITSVLISALKSESEDQVVAAARTLGEIGDLGAIPAIKACLEEAPSDRATKEMNKAIDYIGLAHAFAETS